MNKKHSKNKNYPPDRVLVYRMILTLALIGLIVPFAAEAILPFFFPDQQLEGIETWNQYVSMILGIVAAIMSVVSLVLCYRSERQSNEAYHKTDKALALMQLQLRDIRQKQDEINNVVQRSTFLDMDNTITIRGGKVASDEQKP